ncbi:MAG: hypothetical protein Q4G33_10720 [bacterium]|nr:hypothetical protein [bacterium]
MDKIYKITLAGIAVTSAIACLAAKVLSAESEVKPIITNNEINETRFFPNANAAPYDEAVYCVKTQFPDRAERLINSDEIYHYINEDARIDNLTENMSIYDGRLIKKE